MTKKQIDELNAGILDNHEKWVRAPKPCPQCRILVVNNVVTHEAGCPIDYRKRQFKVKRKSSN